jgi:2-haloacid dehalogenase
MLDIQHLGPLFHRVFGDRKLVNEWYAQLVLYSEAITLAGGPYTPFFTSSKAILKLMGSIHSVSIQQADIDELGVLSATMPAHPDVPAGLKQLKDAGFRLVTLTNSPPDAQIKQLKAAGIDGWFEQLLSVDRVGRYKPATQVYQMAADELIVPTAAIWCRPPCGITLGRNIPAVNQRLWRGQAMPRRPRWRCRGGPRQQLSGRISRASLRN